MVDTYQISKVCDELVDKASELANQLAEHDSTSIEIDEEVTIILQVLRRTK